MSAITIIRQGGDLKFVFDRDGADINGFVCLIEVKIFPSDTAIISRVIPAVGNEWPGFLTSSETAPLDVGLYWLIAKITNSQTDEERQVPERFQVSPEWV
jgi:hypothetical protein